MKIHSIYDNGGETCDRYVVYYKGKGSLGGMIGNKRGRLFFGMSESPCHPQGFGQHGYGLVGKHNGKKIKFEELPQECQKAVLADLA
jgi:hypothetical protein